MRRKQVARATAAPVAPRLRSSGCPFGELAGPGTGRGVVAGGRSLDCRAHGCLPSAEGVRRRVLTVFTLGRGGSWPARCGCRPLRLATSPPPCEDDGGRTGGWAGGSGAQPDRPGSQGAAVAVRCGVLVQAGASRRSNACLYMGRSGTGTEPRAEQTAGQDVGALKGRGCPGRRAAPRGRGRRRSAVRSEQGRTAAGRQVGQCTDVRPTSSVVDLDLGHGRLLWVGCSSSRHRVRTSREGPAISGAGAGGRVWPSSSGRQGGSGCAWGKAHGGSGVSGALVKETKRRSRSGRPGWRPIRPGRWRHAGPSVRSRSAQMPRESSSSTAAGGPGRFEAGQPGGGTFQAVGSADVEHEESGQWCGSGCRVQVLGEQVGVSGRHAALPPGRDSSPRRWR